MVNHAEIKQETCTYTKHITFDNNNNNMKMLQIFILIFILFDGFTYVSLPWAFDGDELFPLPANRKMIGKLYYHIFHRIHSSADSCCLFYLLFLKRVGGFRSQGYDYTLFIRIDGKKNEIKNTTFHLYIKTNCL